MTRSQASRTGTPPTARARPTARTVSPESSEDDDLREEQELRETYGAPGKTYLPDGDIIEGVEYSNVFEEDLEDRRPNPFTRPTAEDSRLFEPRSPDKAWDYHLRYSTSASPEREEEEVLLVDLTAETPLRDLRIGAQGSANRSNAYPSIIRPTGEKFFTPVETGQQELDRGQDELSEFTGPRLMKDILGERKRLEGKGKTPIRGDPPSTEDIRNRLLIQQ